MKKQILNCLVFLSLSIMLLTSCKKEDNDDNNRQNERKVKYELSGNFTGKLLVVTSTNSGQLQQFNAVALPWTKELTYDKNVLGAGISLRTENDNKGIAGQTLTLKVFLNGQLKDTKPATADVNGIVNMTTSFYTF